MHPYAVKHLRSCEPKFIEHIDRIGVIRLSRDRDVDLFGALLRSVTHQQLAGSAAKAIWARVLALFSDGIPQAEQLLALTDEQLRAAGLSRAKAMAMKDIAAKSLEGVIPSPRSIARMSEKNIYERLTQMRGVGPWTVEMLLIFTLRRPDVMPVTDYGVRKGFQLLFGARKLPKPAQLSKIAERWRPHRTTAALYLWRIADAGKKTGTARKPRARAKPPVARNR